MLPLLAGGCAQPEPPDPALSLQAALATHEASLAGIGARPAAAATEGSEPPRPASRPPSAASAAPTMAGQLVGQTSGAVLRWLGEPRLRREEGPAEIWHYQATQCHLDLVFYPEGGPAGPMRVAFAAARAAGAARRAEAACLRDIGRGAARPALPGPGGPEGVG